MKRQDYFYQTKSFIVFLLLLVLLHQPAPVFSSEDTSMSINGAAMKLVQFCIDPRVGLDEQAVSILVAHVLSLKQNKEFALPKSLDSTGVYYEFDTKINFSRFIDYSYSALIPPVITRPSSLRYSVWTNSKGESQKLPDSWKPISPGEAPLIIHGLQRESDTPDLNTNVYHEYDVRRTLILLNHAGRQVLISISKQVSKSGVGKKGVIMGNDNDWNYYYSGEPGTPRTGLGWVKSYIYDFFSVGVYLESGNSPTIVKSGFFHWLRAGWSGINFVKPNHIIAGMKRFSRDCKMSLESPLLPAPRQIISIYERLSNMPTFDLNKKYAALKKEQLSSAARAGKISKSEPDEQVSFTDTPKEQMLQELMLEYLKVILGKSTLLGKQYFSFMPSS